MAKSRSGRQARLSYELSQIVNAGKCEKLESVDFSDPSRPKTCLEVDFPILPINKIAEIEGNAGKPIYQMSKWWARRRSSVFRSMLLASAMKAPSDPSYAAKLVWDVYYGNHQCKGSFTHLKVADIFMGGGTTLVEGSRLGMQMFGVDLNPVAWFVVKQELSKVDLNEVKRLLKDIEAEVRPQIIPFYYCDGPNGEKGTWTHLSTGRVMEDDFEPFSLQSEERKDYIYEGPEIVYTFWAKHGSCQVTGCGHRTPIMTSPIVAEKSLTIKCWVHTCEACGTEFDIEDRHARLAPGSPLFVASNEKAFSVINPNRGVDCPKCGYTHIIKLDKGKSKKVKLSLLVHPQWLNGNSNMDSQGQLFGGTAQDDALSTAKWSYERAKNIRVLEVRGDLPLEVTCPETGITFKTDKRGGTVPKKSRFSCASCGTVQDIATTIRNTGKSAPVAGYAIQGFSKNLKNIGSPYGGRYFKPFDEKLAKQYSAACIEWEQRKDSDLMGFWPREELPFGFMTAVANGDLRTNYGYTHWWTMFNPRQLLVHSQFIKALDSATKKGYSKAAVDAVLGSYIQILRYHSMFSIYQIEYDKMIPHFSNNNYYPKNRMLEGNIFSPIGAGNFSTLCDWIEDGLEWASSPWELVAKENLKKQFTTVGNLISNKSEKVYPGDSVGEPKIVQGSATDLSMWKNEEFDLVVTDPPFGGLLHYSELADFFYVWIRILLHDRYPQIFASEHSPKALEVVANKAREPEDADGFYQRLLTAAWREAHRILKPGGTLTFTFHHSSDEPWILVLDSLFQAGFYLEATYPIRSDETKGDGEYGSKTIEYDIIHVCRKRTHDPESVSWGRMRRAVLSEVRRLQQLLENHAKGGLPPADLHVIRRGKALEYYSRHYGKVFVDEDRSMSVKEALMGINQLIDEDTNHTKNPLPTIAEPTTRQFLRIFDGTFEVLRDQMHKFLGGTGYTPEEFVNRGWCEERSKVFYLIEPLKFAQGWHGRHRRNLTIDFDQAWFLIGACFDGSGINASDTLNNENFKPHPALKSLLEWLMVRGANLSIRSAARRALTIYNTWLNSHQPRAQQLSLFFDEV